METTDEMKQEFYDSQPVRAAKCEKILEVMNGQDLGECFTILVYAWSRLTQFALAENPEAAEEIISNSKALSEKIKGAVDTVVKYTNIDREMKP